MSKRKPILVMIHGFRGTHHGLALIARELTDNFDVRVPDLPGFANGPKLDNYSLEEYVTWLEKFINYCPDKQIYLLGHSFGSIICSAYTAKNPNKIKKLILVNPIGAPALEGPRQFLTKFAVYYYKIGATLPPGLAQKWLSSNIIVTGMSISMAKTKSKSLRKYIHNQHRKYFSRFISPSSVLKSFQTSISFSVRDFASKVKVPTLLIAGDLDDITPLIKQLELVEMFPNAELKVIHGVGHLTHYETPVDVANLTEAFIFTDELKSRK